MSEKKSTGRRALPEGNKLSKFRLPELKKDIVQLTLIVMTILMGAVSVYLVMASINAGTNALLSSYNASYASEREASYQALYENYYTQAEEQYHVSNRVSISIGDLAETANLEVLTVSDVEYVIEESSDNSSNITSWLEVPGQGTYVVDLRATEFIVDDERSYVLVRAPYPELTNITIDYINVRKLLFQNDLLNDSYMIGENLAKQQTHSADLLIKKELASNQYFYISAQKAAVSTIQCLVKQLNPEVTDLTVEVEFY